jgi:hypothetical protein
MVVPSSDLLNDALLVIKPQAINYYMASGRITNNMGQYITTYNDPVVIQGSFQPVPRNQYQQLGLDLQKSYFNLYTSTDIIDVARDVSGDQIEFNSVRYQCESLTKWFDIDGWVAIRCVAILNFS